MDSDSYLGSISMFGGNFAVRGWAMCDGQLLAISQYEALFSLLGTTFGGDGRTSFGLPDLRGRVGIHAGNGPGLTPRQIGQRSGTESVTLAPSQIPSHNHTFSSGAGPGAAGTSAPGNYLAVNAGADTIYTTSAPSGTAMGNSSIANNGDSRAHENMQPWLCITYEIALVGVYPSRN